MRKKYLRNGVIAGNAVCPYLDHIKAALNILRKEISVEWNGSEGNCLSEASYFPSNGMELKF